MAWPFGNSANEDIDEDAALTEDRLKIMAKSKGSYPDISRNQL